MVVYSKPEFQNIPIALSRIDRWVVWKGNKIPYDASAVNSKADTTNPHTWTSYALACTAYEEGGYSGIGFVFNGDGVVGIDIDNCFFDGNPKPEAIAFLQNVGCQYIEVSPSGNGLHGLGFVKDPPLVGVRGSYKGLRIEMYASKRFFTVTGKVVSAGSIENLPGYKHFYSQIKTNSPTEDTEDTEATESVISVGLNELPISTKPNSYGRRNQAIFNFARDLKSRYPEKTSAEVMPLVYAWFLENLNNISTKDFHLTKADFELAWDKVKFPDNVIDRKVLFGIDAISKNPGHEFGQVGGKLFCICARLQIIHHDEPFFLSSRTAGKWLNIHFTDAAALLRVFVMRRWIQVAIPGTSTKAARYSMEKDAASVIDDVKNYGDM